MVTQGFSKHPSILDVAENNLLKGKYFNFYYKKIKFDQYFNKCFIVNRLYSK